MLDSDGDEPASKRAKDDTSIKITRIEAKVNDVRDDILRQNERGHRRYFASQLKIKAPYGATTNHS